MIPFQLGGKTVTFTGATSAPTSVQIVPSNEVINTQVVITNVGAVTVFVGWGQSDAEAKANAAVPTSTPAFSFPVLAATQVSLTLPAYSYITGITGSSTAIVYVSPGYGE